MSLSEHYKIADDGLVKRSCKVCDWYRTLEPKDRIWFDEKAREALASHGLMQKLRRTAILSGLNASRSTWHYHMHEHHLELVSGDDPGLTSRSVRRAKARQ